MLDAQDLIDLLALEPLPGEGGLYRRTWFADETVAPSALPARYGRAKALGSAIFYLLTSAPDSFSALHRLPSDEIYHFYLGDPVELVLLPPVGGGEVVVLGHDLLAGQRVQWRVSRGVWQGSRLVSGGRFALLGTTMAPAFDDDDLELGERRELAARYPGHRELIHALTRARGR